MTPKQTKRWETKDGDSIRICDMGFGHLFNTIELLRRMATAKQLNTLCDPPMMIGEMAQEAADREYFDLCGMNVDEFAEQELDCYKELLLEAERRDMFEGCDVDGWIWAEPWKIEVDRRKGLTA